MTATAPRATEQRRRGRGTAPPPGRSGRWRGWRGLMGWALALALLLAPPLGLPPAAPLAWAASGACITGGGQVTCTFSHTGAAQTWTVPG